MGLGTNAGFVSSAPAGDPGDIDDQFNEKQMAVKDTSPVGSYKVTEIGWYQQRADNGANNYTVGIYAHDGVNNRPGALIAAQAAGSVGANTPGWAKVTGLNITLASGTIYWIAVGNDYIGSGTNRYEYADAATGAHVITDAGASPSFLTSPYPAIVADTRLAYIYAKYEAAGGATNVIYMII